MFPENCERCGLETDDLKGVAKDNIISWYICPWCIESLQLRAALENSQSLFDRIYDGDSIISSGDLHTANAQNQQALNDTAPAGEEDEDD